MNINTEQSTWLFKREADWPDREIDEYDPAWWTAATVKWRYTIHANVDEQGSLSFAVSRNSQNEGLDSDHIGDLDTDCATLKEAKAIAEQWQAERYSDHESEFIESGGNTADAQEAFRKEWSGKFKCPRCGKPITDSDTIKEILEILDNDVVEVICENCAFLEMEAREASG